MLKQELLLSSSSQSGECQSTEDLPPCSEATATLGVSPTLPDTALQSLLFLPSSRAQQLQLSAGDYINWGFAFILERIQGASIIIFQLLIWWLCQHCCCPGHSGARLSFDPSCWNGSGFCGLTSNCVCFQQEGSVFLSPLQWASISSKWVSVYQLSFIELVFGRLPSCSLPSHLHFGSLFPQLSQYSFLSNVLFFTPLLLHPSELDPFLHLMCLSKVSHLLLTPLNSI